MLQMLQMLLLLFLLLVLCALFTLKIELIHAFSEIQRNENIRKNAAPNIHIHHLILILCCFTLTITIHSI